MIARKQYRIVIGIDTGVETGFAMWDKELRRLVIVESRMIHEAMDTVKGFAGPATLVRVEDARQAVYGRQNDAHKLKGAGSVMRDAKIWEDFLTGLGLDFEMLRPRKQFTKLSSEAFQKITGWAGRTNNHARDAAMLVFGY
ncbi:MAG TPA: hypothetical protein VGM31_14360 [Puia sp.]|jgi:hypothetical protein